MLNQVFERCYLRSVLDLNFYPDLSTSTWVSTTYEECHNWFLPIISVDLPDKDVRGISHLPKLFGHGETFGFNRVGEKLVAAE